jgi:probable phosphoglycerate mutase
VTSRRIVLVRHGETEWSTARRHTGRSDVALTARGQAEADLVQARLAGAAFGLVLASPLRRAWETAERAGLRPVADEDLLEWDYGRYEGRTTEEIRAEIPGWSVWTHPVLGGETVDDVGRRADRVIERCLDPTIDGDVVLVSHAHLLRILGARWIGLPPVAGRHLTLDTASVSVLGYEREVRVIRSWNEPCRASVR